MYVSTIVCLVFGIILLSVQCICAYLVVRRRRSYPIAGRGWQYIMATQCINMIGVGFSIFMTLALPGRAIPCAIMPLTSFLMQFIPLIICARGWIVVCRLEIMNVQMERRRSPMRELSSIPGYFFMANRSWTKRFAILYVCTGVVWASATLIWSLMQFSGTDAFLNAPPCGPDDWLVLHLPELEYVVFIIPMIVWVMWRLKTRISADIDQDGMDDSVFVRSEVYFGVSCMFVCIALVAAVTELAPVWIPFAFMLIQVLFSGIFVVSALHRSFDMSRRLNSQIRQSRAKKGVILPHQAPFYTLRHILHNPSTYDVLLRFLQKEFSSENALFYTEARAFQVMCRGLERRMPNAWPQPMNSEPHSSSSAFGSVTTTATLTTITFKSSPVAPVQHHRQPSLHPPLSSGHMPSPVSREEMKHVYDWCLRMYSEYVMRGASQEINLPDDIATTITRQVAQLKKEWTLPNPPPFVLSTLFFSGQDAIFKLIDTDSFRRFLITKDFSDIIQRADESHMQFMEQQQPSLHLRIDHAIEIPGTCDIVE